MDAHEHQKRQAYINDLTDLAAKYGKVKGLTVTVEIALTEGKGK